MASTGNSSVDARLNKKARREAAKQAKQQVVEQGGTQTPEQEQAKAAKPGTLPALPKMPRVRKPKPEVPCACGCGLTTRRVWHPGHDARHHGWVRRVQAGIVTLEQIPEGERQVVAQAVRASAASAA